VYLLNKIYIGKAVTASMNITNFTPASAEAITFATPTVSSDVGKLQKMTIGVNSATGKWESVLPPYSLTRLTFHK